MAIHAIHDSELERLFNEYKNKRACEEELKRWRSWIEERSEEIRAKRDVLVHELYQLRNMVCKAECGEALPSYDVALADLELQLKCAYEREGDLQAKRSFYMQNAMDAYGREERALQVEKARKCNKRIDQVRFEIYEMGQRRQTLRFASAHRMLEDADWFDEYIVQEYQFFFAIQQALTERLEKLRDNLEEVDRLLVDISDAATAAEDAWAKRLAEVRRQRRGGSS